MIVTIFMFLTETSCEHVISDLFELEVLKIFFLGCCYIYCSDVGKTSEGVILWSIDISVENFTLNCFFFNFTALELSVSRIYAVFTVLQYMNILQSIFKMSSAVILWGQ